MTVQVTVRFSGDDLAKFTKRLSQKLPVAAADAIQEYAVGLAEDLRVAATTDPLRPITPDRRGASLLIRAKRLSRNRSVIMMPRGLSYLDSMRPHYVSLKRGRSVTDWVKRNYGGATVSGRSNVRMGPRGGIKGFLFVTPHRFVQPTLMRSRNKLSNNLRKGIRKAISSSVGGV